MKNTNNFIFDIDNITVAAPGENDDFNFMYDSLEDIKQCLNCSKPECTNCLRWKNGV